MPPHYDPRTLAKHSPPEPAAEPGPRYPPALSKSELRDLYRRNPTPEVKRLLWEVARLHALGRRAAQFASCFPLYAGQTTTSAYHIILGALRRELEVEDVWLNADAEINALCDVAPPATTAPTRLAPINPLS